MITFQNDHFLLFARGGGKDTMI